MVKNKARRLLTPLHSLILTSGIPQKTREYKMAFLGQIHFYAILIPVSKGLEAATYAKDESCHRFAFKSGLMHRSHLPPSG